MDKQDRCNNNIRCAIEAQFSGVVTKPDLQRRVLQQVRGEAKVKKKLSVGLVFAVLLAILLIGIAIAASVNVFDLFARYEGDEYLAKLDQASQFCENVAVEIPENGPYPAAKFIVNQAYYDGKSLIIAYTLSQQWIPSRFMNSEDALSENNDLISEKYLDMPKPYLDYILSPQDIVLIEEKLTADGKMFLEGWSQSIDDTYVMTSDIRIDAARLNLSHMPDGTMVGYIEFAYPLPQEAQDQEELPIEFFFNRGGFQYYEDETGFYRKDTPYDQLSLPITIKRNAQSPEMLYGEQNFDDYHVAASAFISDIEINVHIILSASAEKIQEFAESSQWLGYDLYAGDEICTIIGQHDDRDTNNITLDISYMIPENSTDLRLVPQHAHLGRQIDEVVSLHPVR